MKTTLPLDVIDRIIDALNDTLEQNKSTGVIGVPLFGGITQGAISKTQGRTFGVIMQSADCHQFISKLSTRRDHAKLSSGLTQLVNERDAGEKWISEARAMLDEISEKETQSMPVYSDIKAESEAKISFASLNPEQVEKIEKTISTGEAKIQKMSKDVLDLTAKTRVEITSQEQKKLQNLIPGFKHSFPIQIGV